MEQNDKLEAALGVFLHYGYKKTSMDDLAGAFGISRQGLYKNYSSKQEIFEKVFTYHVERSLQGVKSALHAPNGTLHGKLERAFHFAAGQYINRLRSSPHSYEILHIVSDRDDKEHHHNLYQEMFKNFLKTNKVSPANGTLDDVVATMMAALDGLVHMAASEKEFDKGARHIIAALVPEKE